MTKQHAKLPSRSRAFFQDLRSSFVVCQFFQAQSSAIYSSFYLTLHTSYSVIFFRFLVSATAGLINLIFQCTFNIFLPIIFIPAFFFRKKGYINFVPSRSIVHLSVHPSICNISCKCIFS